MKPPCAFALALVFAALDASGQAPTRILQVKQMCAAVYAGGPLTVADFLPMRLSGVGYYGPPPNVRYSYFRGIPIVYVSNPDPRRQPDVFQVSIAGTDGTYLYLTSSTYGRSFRMNIAGTATGVDSIPPGLSGPAPGAPVQFPVEQVNDAVARLIYGGRQYAVQRPLGFEGLPTINGPWVSTDQRASFLVCGAHVRPTGSQPPAARTSLPETYAMGDAHPDLKEIVRRMYANARAKEGDPQFFGRQSVKPPADDVLITPDDLISAGAAGETNLFVSRAAILLPANLHLAALAYAWAAALQSGIPWEGDESSEFELRNELFKLDRIALMLTGGDRRALVDLLTAKNKENGDVLSGMDVMKALGALQVIIAHQLPDHSPATIKAVGDALPPLMNEGDARGFARISMRPDGMAAVEAFKDIVLQQRIQAQSPPAWLRGCMGSPNPWCVYGGLQMPQNGVAAKLTGLYKLRTARIAALNLH